MRAVLVSLLATLRLKNSTLYREYIRGERYGYEIANYVHKQIENTNLNDEQIHNLNELEAFLYLTDEKSSDAEVRVGISVSVLELGRLLEAIKNDSHLPESQYLSTRTLNSDLGRIQSLVNLASQYDDPKLSHNTIAELASLIELYGPPTHS